MIYLEFAKLKEWLQGNKLFLNIDKTTYMIIGTQRMLTDENGEKLLPVFTLDGEPIQQNLQRNILGLR